MEPSIDQVKLARLRERYASATGGDIYDPAFRRVAETQFRGGETRKWPFSPAMLLDAPFGPNALAENSADLDIALIGVPMDLGVTNRTGTRLGPRAVRSVERIGPYEHVMKALPIHERRVADVGDVPFASRYSLEQCHADIERFFGSAVGAGVRTLAVGGDHSISLPILKAVGRKRLRTGMTGGGSRRCKSRSRVIPGGAKCREGDRAVPPMKRTLP